MNPGWKKLLVAIDFSDESREALRTALTLMTTPEHRLAVMHVVETVPWMMRGNEVLMLLTKPTAHLKLEAHQRLWRWLSLENAPEDQVSAVVAFGNPAAEVVRRATVTQADLIVVARKGGPRRRSWFGRSFVADLQRRAPCAVLAVCPGGRAVDASPRREERERLLPAFGRIGNSNAYS